MRRALSDPGAESGNHAGAVDRPIYLCLGLAGAGVVDCFDHAAVYIDPPRRSTPRDLAFLYGAPRHGSHGMADIRRNIDRLGTGWYGDLRCGRAISSAAAGRGAQ